MKHHELYTNCLIRTASWQPDSQRTWFWQWAASDPLGCSQSAIRPQSSLSADCWTHWRLLLFWVLCQLALTAIPSNFWAPSDHPKQVLLPHAATCRKVGLVGPLPFVQNAGANISQVSHNMHPSHGTDITISEHKPRPLSPLTLLRSRSRLSCMGPFNPTFAQTPLRYRHQCLVQGCFG